MHNAMSMSLYFPRMPFVALFAWLGLFLLLAKVVNARAKRPVMNPWAWFACTFALGYAAAIAVGVAQGAPHLADLARAVQPMTAIAVGLGIWQAPRWRAKYPHPVR